MIMIRNGEPYGVSDQSEVAAGHGLLEGPLTLQDYGPLVGTSLELFFICMIQWGEDQIFPEPSEELNWALKTFEISEITKILRSLSNYNLTHSSEKEIVVRLLY